MDLLQNYNTFLHNNLSFPHLKILATIYRSLTQYNSDIAIGLYISANVGITHIATQ